MITESKPYSLYHYFGGRQVAGDSGRHGDVYDPSSGTVTKHVPFASRAKVEQAITTAEQAFPGCAATPPAKRAQVMFAFRDLIGQNMEKPAGAEFHFKSASSQVL